MALAEPVDDTPPFTLYAEPRLDDREHRLLDAVRWVNGRGTPATPTAIAAEAHVPVIGATIDQLRRELAALVSAGLLGEVIPPPPRAARYTLTAGGRIALGLAQPAESECGRCTLDVLIVDVKGRTVALEPVEILQRFPCPVCRQVEMKGHDRKAPCVRCGGEKWLGEVVPGRAVAIDERGRARHFARRFGRQPGEALYAVHSCVR